MSTITKERMEWLSNISGRDDIDEIDGEEIRELARIALASLEAEPIYQLWDEGYYDTQKETYDAVLNAVGTGVRGRIVYTAPPAPVSVPDELTREEYKRRFMEDDNFDDTFRGGWNAAIARFKEMNKCL